MAVKLVDQSEQLQESNERQFSKANIIQTTINKSVLNVKTKFDHENNKDQGLFEKGVSDNQLKSIREDLVSHHADLILSSFVSNESRKALVDIVFKEQRFSNDDTGHDKAEYIVSEIVGLGFIEKILIDDDSITDIGWNGTFLTVQSNDRYQVFTPEELMLDDPETAIFRIVKKFADSVGKSFNRSYPILDSVAGNLRISAMHQICSPDGTTMSLRVVKPNLALKEENFTDFAPEFVLDFLRTVMATRANVVVAGETGSGKTELLKLLLSFSNKEDRILMIEDVQETHVKTLLPEHDIYSWVTSEKVKIIDEVVTSLRNFPKWIVVSETRGSEAYEMIQAALTDHKIITTVHAVSCRAIPRRFITMSSMGYSVNEKSVEEDILTYFDFGIHIKTLKVPIDREKNLFRIVRYLSEVVEYSTEGIKTLFKQTYYYGKFYVTTGELSEGFKERMGEKFVNFDFPVMKNQEIEKSEELTKFLRKASEAYENKQPANSK